MQGDTDIAPLGSLLSDPSRCRVLLALADGRSLAASALAAEAGVAPSTASEHLRKLLEAGLLVVEARGRHRYYRLAGPRVAQLLEMLMQHSPQQPIRSLREGTRAHALRQARFCYDHLAGRLGVALMDALLDRRTLIRVDLHADADGAGGEGRATTSDGDIEYRLSEGGAQWLRDFGIDLDTIQTGRRALIRHCLDWSEQRHHLAGALGHAVAARLFALGWLAPGRQGRVVLITDSGAVALRTQFGIELDVRAPAVPGPSASNRQPHAATLSYTVNSKAR